jgi:hypothetical protein
MRGWAIAAGLVTASGALIVAGLAAVRAQASAERLTGALVAAELRARPTEPAAVAAAVAAAASPAPAPPPGASAPTADAPAPTPPALPPVSFRQTNTYNGNVVYVPTDCAADYDVVLHFHGAHPYLKDLAEKAQLHAVVVVYNAGNGAERYAQAFQAGGILPSLLKQVAMAVAPLCGGASAKPRRIALSAWSAGYGATEKLITRAEDRDRIDAVLLADGLHAGFADTFRRQFAPNALQAFRDFGELAKRGEKLFAITHSSIGTDGYASTTECSKLLLKALNVPVEGELVSGKAGEFSIEGSSGDDKAAHITQFRQMDRALYSKLRARWSR